MRSFILPVLLSGLLLPLSAHANVHTFSGQGYDLHVNADGASFSDNVLSINSTISLLKSAGMNLRAATFSDYFLDIDIHSGYQLTGISLSILGSWNFDYDPIQGAFPAIASVDFYVFNHDWAFEGFDRDNIFGLNAVTRRAIADPSYEPATSAPILPNGNFSAIKSLDLTKGYDAYLGLPTGLNHLELYGAVRATGYGAYGTIDVESIQIKFQVSAVPEPSAYAMLGLGLGLMGVAARRRKSS